MTEDTRQEIRVLDVSSPRLFPFWLAEKAGVNVTMLNPDPEDLNQSRYQSRYVKGRAIDFVDEFAGTTLPFADNSFDIVTSISVIEHINGDGDIDMVREMARVTRPGGLIILTFPVKGVFDKEYRKERCYPTQEIDPERDAYFFQRFYDAEQIRKRLLTHVGMHEDGRAYFVEITPDWFADYEATWMRQGYPWIINDARFMAEYFQLAEDHPSDRMGICGIFIRVDEEGEHI
ncbi:MAG: methyltransferase domain-containing protein [Gammaproteobacteria bacterium]|nr:methyltransferase domain-containing protein [Gammaproteobacteria bacterium]